MLYLEHEGENVVDWRLQVLSLLGADRIEDLESCMDISLLDSDEPVMCLELSGCVPARVDWFPKSVPSPQTSRHIRQGAGRRVSRCNPTYIFVSTCDHIPHGRTTYRNRGAVHDDNAVCIPQRFVEGATRPCVFHLPSCFSVIDELKYGMRGVMKDDEATVGGESMF